MSLLTPITIRQPSGNPPELPAVRSGTSACGQLPRTAPAQGPAAGSGSRLVSVEGAGADAVRGVGRRSAGGDRGGRRRGERDQVGRGELHLKPTPPGRDVDRREVQRRGVEHRRQPLALPERADAAADVTGGPLRQRPVGERRPLAAGRRGQRLEVQLAGRPARPRPSARRRPRSTSVLKTRAAGTPSAAPPPRRSSGRRRERRTGARCARTPRRVSSAVAGVPLPATIGRYQPAVTGVPTTDRRRPGDPGQHQARRFAAGQAQVPAQSLGVQGRAPLEDLHPPDPALTQQRPQPLQREGQHVGDLDAARVRGGRGGVGVDVGDVGSARLPPTVAANSATRWERTTAGSGS